MLKDLLFVCMLVCVLAMTVFHIDTEVKKTQSPTITRYPGTLRQRWKVTQYNNQVLYLTTLDLTVLSCLIQTVLLLHLNSSIFVHS